MAEKIADYTDKQLIANAVTILSIEAEAVSWQKTHIGPEFVRAARLLAGFKGRAIVMGIGKSGIIGRKLASTMASTGTPAVFVHPTESLHGELGILTRDDVLLAISHSGETEELRKVLQVIKSLRIPVIAITGKAHSMLGRSSDIMLNISVKREACPYNLAPTASTTAALAMGDALALAVMQLRGFAREDFARLHPDGSLGRILTMKVKEVMHTGKENPLINEHKSVHDALIIMTRTRLGAASIVNRHNQLVGVFTDGDLRRGLQKDSRLLEHHLADVMTRKPKCVSADVILYDAKELFKKYGVDNLPVVDEHNRPVGIIDERDII